MFVRHRAMVRAEQPPLKYLVVREKSTGKFVRVSEGMAKAKEKLKPNEEVIEVWEKDPSIAAFIDLMNRALDKPKEQALDVSVAVDWDKRVARMREARKRIGKK